MNPCINCLLDTEEKIKQNNFQKQSKGNKLWYSTYKAETEELKKVLKLAGIKDVYSKTFGRKRTTFNFVKACIDALNKLNTQKLNDSNN